MAGTAGAACWPNVAAADMANSPHGPGLVSREPEKHFQAWRAGELQCARHEVRLGLHAALEQCQGFGLSTGDDSADELRKVAGELALDLRAAGDAGTQVEHGSDALGAALEQLNHRASEPVCAEHGVSGPGVGELQCDLESFHHLTSAAWT